MEKAEPDSSLHEKCDNTDQKRRLDNEEEGCSSQEVFKKARYSWQIKGKSDVYKNSQKQEHEKFEVNNDLKSSSSEKTFTDIESKKDNDKNEQGKTVISNKGKETKLDSPNTDILSSDSEQAIAAIPVKDAKKLVDQTDKKTRVSSIETQSKFEMLREIGNEYTERIEEFLKTQAKEFVNTCESSESSDSDIEEIKEEVINECEDVLTEYARETYGSSPNQSGSPLPRNPIGMRSHGRLSFDSPQLNHHLFNISGWLWQKQEIGCAIVDNVFNRTLEEMGLSPDPEANLQATTRLRVEHQSIEAAISNQGLTLQDNMDEDTNDYMSSNGDSEESTDKTNTETMADIHTNSSTSLPASTDQSSINNYKIERFNHAKNEIEISSINDIGCSISSSDRDTYLNLKVIENVEEGNLDNKSFLSLPKVSAKVSEDLMCSEFNKNGNDLKITKDICKSSKTVKEVQEANKISFDNKMETGYDDNSAKVELEEYDGPNPSGVPDNILDMAVSTAIQSKGLL